MRVRQTSRTTSPPRSLFNGRRSERDWGCQMPVQTELIDWMTRVEAEYRAMPGLRLTERQMQRLWGLDGGTCAAIVRMLVNRGVLWETPTHRYALAASSKGAPHASVERS